MTLQLDRLDNLGASAFEGFVVRKDLVRRYAKAYPVPAYVVEFLLGRYCASTDDAEIKEGLEIVEKQLKDRCVRTGQEEVFKNEAYRKGSVRIIDTVRARLDAKNACYVAELPSLALRDVRIPDSMVEENDRILIDASTPR
jgi:ATP-dependent Lon protease